MTPRNDPRIFCGPPLPLDDRTVLQPSVVFTGEEQPRDTQGRYRDTQRPYRGEDMTPEYRQQLLSYSPLGRQILKADGQPRALTYAQLWRQVVEREAATQGRR